MSDTERTGRPNQKTRTRKDLLQAAARLMRQGRKPSLEEIAEEGLVSRATAYRYFPNVEALLLDASLDIAIPGADELFAGERSGDPVRRLQQVDTTLHDMILANEAPLRMMLVHSLQRGIGNEHDDVPRRQNRRTPLIEAALQPTEDEFEPAALDRLRKALALIIGTEAMVVFKDVLRLGDSEARKVKSWAIQALVDAARRPAARD